MEIIVDPEVLRKELSVFQNLILRDAALIELSNIVIEAQEGGKLLIYGTDMDVSLRCETELGAAEVVTAGRTCLKGHKLIDVLATLNGTVKNICLRRETNDWTSLLFGKSHFKIAGVSPDTFPDLRFDYEGEQTQFPRTLFSQFLASTGFAISKENSGKYNIAGANLTVDESKATMVATDGFRIAHIKSDITGNFDDIIPKKAASILSRLIVDSDEESVQISSDERQGYFTIGKRKLAFRKLTGKFPDVDKAIPKEHDHTASFNLSNLRSAIKRADLFSEKNNYSPITLSLKPGELEVSSRSFEEGSGVEVLEAEYDGVEIKIKLKSQHLTDFFNSINTSEGSENAITVSMGFTEDLMKPTTWSVKGTSELSFDYGCVITKLR